MVDICAIASGSNGNCYYVGNSEDAVLVDVGISRKQVLLRMVNRGLDPAKIRGIFISHEHADHMRGVKVLAKVLQVPVYMTRQTFENTWNPNRPGMYALFAPGEAVELNSLIIHPFLKNHDAAEPCSFRVETNERSVGVFTDIGTPCDNLVDHFKQCDAMFLESNYDEEMLQTGPYPWHLKKRVASDVGHLSNVQAVNLTKEHASEKLQTIFLSHLSGENNTPAIAEEAFASLKVKHKVVLTSRHDASEVLKVV